MFIEIMLALYTRCEEAGELAFPLGPPGAEEFERPHAHGTSGAQVIVQIQ